MGGVPEDKDYALDGKDRREWDDAWGSRLLRKPVGPLAVDLSARLQLSEVEVAGFALEPAIAGTLYTSYRVFGDRCPLCGVETSDADRLGVSFDVRFGPS